MNAVQAYYDKAAEILSSVCQIARERKTLVPQLGSASAEAAESAAPASTTSTLRATVTGQCPVSHCHQDLIHPSSATRRPNP